MIEEPGSATVQAPAAHAEVQGGFIFHLKFGWRLVYLRMVRRLRSLQVMYERDNIELSEAYGIIDAFFHDCNHLEEWLIGDIEGDYALPPEIRSKVRSWKNRQKDSLVIAEAYSNTNKHFGREKESQIDARLIGLQVLTGGHRILIEVTKRGVVTQLDALPLMEACAAAWEKFLVDNKIEVPVP